MANIYYVHKLGFHILFTYENEREETEYDEVIRHLINPVFKIHLLGGVNLYSIRWQW